MLKTVILLIATLVSTDSDINYTIYEDGPRTVYDGTARLYADGSNLYPCLSYCFDVPKGQLSGPVISSNPFEPHLPFDWWEETENGIEVLWCRSSLPLNPLTGEDLQTYPIEIPKNFIFYIIKTKFDGDDLTELLDDWGEENSPWDLDGNGVIDGGDLAILLSGWKID